MFIALLHAMAFIVASRILALFRRTRLAARQILAGCAVLFVAWLAGAFLHDA